MRALVTNDDGIDSEGLRQLALVAVAAGLQVSIAAPLSDSSGTSASLTAVTAEGKVVVEPRTLDGLEQIPTQAVAAAPGFIVLLAQRGAFGEPPDIVLAGINRGANTGNAVLHSGTVGAVLTAASEGCRGLAVSLAARKPSNWETAAQVALPLIGCLDGLDEGVALNLNVPDVTESALRGVRRAHLARFGFVQTTVAEVGAGYVKLGVGERDAQLEPESDVALLAQGFATVTALSPLCERSDVELPDLSFRPAGRSRR